VGANYERKNISGTHSIPRKKRNNCEISETSVKSSLRFVAALRLIVRLMHSGVDVAVNLISMTRLCGIMCGP
jgi:hypothetical protein